MFVIKSKAKKGGFWDEKNKRLIDKLETSDKTLTDKYAKKGYIVEETAKKEK